MLTVRMMQMTIHQIVDVIPMRHRLMATARPVDMVFIVSCTAVTGCAGLRICLRDFKAVLVHMIPMGVMEMPVVKVVGVLSMPNGRVTTIWAMNM
jgi:hypothetical protein